MHALWRIDQGTVEDVRSALPSRYRGAYTTVQTVLNRLAERGLLKRRKRGNAILYAPRISETDYVTESIDSTLIGASRDARRAALAQLVGQMDPDEIAELRALAREIELRRSKNG
jgi:predicted transcriptional regulator